MLTLLIALSFWFIVTGVADLARALDEGEHRVISAILGVIWIAAGVIIVANPDIGLTTFALMAGIGFIVRGTVELRAGCQPPLPPRHPRVGRGSPASGRTPATES